MISKRSAFFIGLAGFLLGSLVTVLLFNLPGVQGEQQPIASNDNSDSAAKPPMNVRPLNIQPADVQFTRDVSGDCTIEGTVVFGPDDEALAGALVRLRLLDEPWLTADLPTLAKTDDGGKFAFNNLNSKLQYQLWTYSPGMASAVIDNAPCGAKTDIALIKGASISVTFKSPDDTPIEPLRVQIAGSSLWPSREFYEHLDTKGQQKNYQIAGLETGDYVIWANAKQFAYLSEPIHLQAGEKKELTFVMTKAPYSKVSLQTSGKPMPNTPLIISPDSSSLLQRTYFTNSDGQAVIAALPEDNYQITVLADGFIESTGAALRPGDEITIDLKPGATVNGMVRSDAGQPVSSANIIVEQSSNIRHEFQEKILAASQNGWPRLYDFEGELLSGPPRINIPTVYNSAIAQQSDEQGNFSIDGLAPGKIRISATHPQFVPMTPATGFIEPGSKTDNMMIVMRAGSKAIARITDSNDYPISGAEFTAFSEDGETLGTATADKKGSAALEGLPGIYRVEASSPGFIPVVHRIHGRTGTITELELSLPAADQILRGRVVDERGFGISDAVVTARSSTRGLAHVLVEPCEKDGTFALENAGEGPYHLMVETSDRRAQVGGVSSAAEVTLVLGPDSVITGPVHQPGSLSSAQGSVVSSQSSEFGTSDNLGTTENSKRGGVVVSNSTAPSSVNTQYGQADQLIVTGPPAGKGGLPITVGLGPKGQVVVTSVSPGSAISSAGIKKGDRIIAIDGNRIKTPMAARNAISGPIGSVIMLKIGSKDDNYTAVVQRIRVQAHN